MIYREKYFLAGFYDQECTWRADDFFLPPLPSYCFWVNKWFQLVMLTKSVIDKIRGTLFESWHRWKCLLEFLF
ncbi:MAG: hypothetical protein CML49_11630 [Rhodobacteraceae bacterium]|nr:MAG: hypothetical protein CML49_11630 [Paracoccaceae bacterium]